MTEYSIFDIANWFLTKSSMTPKKLQKLTYYAEAWSRALLKHGLITGTSFEAWAHGPVSPVLYHKYREYGWTEIEQLTDDEKPSIDDEQVTDLLESVWLTYGDKSANELEALTHQEMPWKKARVGLDENEPSNNKISVEEMAAYYLSIYNGD